MNLHLPRILVEGGFLWKVPYHNSGALKRRWFQLKPAKGLLTTATGRLLVQPGRGEISKDTGELAICGGDSASIHDFSYLEAAWPLSLIWMDPDKDLERSPPRELELDEIVEVVRGHNTLAFWQQAINRRLQGLPAPKLCFSLIGRERTLDLAAGSAAEAMCWVRALLSVTLRIKEEKLSRNALTLSPWSEHGLHLKPGVGQGQLPPSALRDRGPDGVIRRSSDSMVSLVDSRGVDGIAPRSGTLGKKEPSFPDTARQDSKLRRNSGSSPYFMTKEGLWSPQAIKAWRCRLFPAVLRGDTAAVVALFDQGCPVDLIEAGTGDTALLLACRLGDVGIARECLQRGSRNDPHPEFGQTALHAAVSAGKEGCARLLLETAAPSMSDVVVANHGDPNQQTPLHIACQGGNVGIVDTLLHHGASVHAVDREGSTALHGAAGGGHNDALASLLDAGGDTLLEEKNKRGNRALHAAAASGHIECVRMLLETAAEPE